jgi:hypothetical protein
MMEAIASDATLTQKFVNLNQGLASFGDVVSSAITRIAGSPGA